MPKNTNKTRDFITENTKLFQQSLKFAFLKLLPKLSTNNKA